MDRSLDSQWPERAHNSIAAPRIHKSCSAHESCTPPAHRGNKNQEPQAEWSPPLFHHEDNVGASSMLPSAPPSDPQQQPLHSSTAGAAPPSSEETEEMHAEPPDLEATSTTRQACPPCVTTRSGRAVKPVERYGHV